MCIRDSVVVVPLLMIALVVFHIFALHEVGAGNPEGVDIEKYRDKKGMPLDGAPFHPYKTFGALPAIGVFFIVFFAIVFFAPTGGGYFIEKPNFEEANFLKTPEHIAPVWYYAPFYSILRAVTFGIPFLGITSKFLGFIIFAASIAILFVVPWLDRSNVQSIRYKGIYSKIAMILFAASFITLGYLGTKPVNELRTLVAQICTVLYFAPFILKIRTFYITSAYLEVAFKHFIMVESMPCAKKSFLDHIKPHRENSFISIFGLDFC